jgi:hypothetical protein
MLRPVSSAITCLAVSTVVSSCGGAARPADQIRSSFARLLNAFGDHDARTACELLFPFGQHQPARALEADLRRLDTPAGRSSYQKYVAQCVPSLARATKLSEYQRGLGGVKLGAVTIHGNVAKAQATSKTGQHATATFVKAAGEWRLVIGSQ